MLNVKTKLASSHRRGPGRRDDITTPPSTRDKNRRSKLSRCFDSNVSLSPSDALMQAASLTVDLCDNDQELGYCAVSNVAVHTDW